MELNRLSSPKTKEQLDKYNLCVEQLEKARKVYQTRVQEFEEVWDECPFLRKHIKFWPTLRFHISINIYRIVIRFIFLESAFQ